MRTAAIALISLAVTMPSFAYPIEFVTGGINFSPLEPADPPRVARFLIFPNVPNPDPPLQNLTYWEVPGIFPIDAGTTWSVSESTAAASGFDWSTLEAAVSDGDNHVFKSTFLPSWYPIPDHRGGGGSTMPRHHFTRIDRVEFRLIAFADLGTGHSASYRHVIVGDGWYVPEPATCIMLISVWFAVMGLRKVR